MDVLSLAEQDTRLQKAAHNEQAGPCPKCGGTDRFRVRHDGERWAWMCRSCWDASQFLPERGRKRGWGDTIDYLRHYRGLSFREAKALASDGQNDEMPTRSALGVGVDYRDTRWQEAKAQSVKAWEFALWGPTGIFALEFAHKRGLTDETIRGAHLGYSNAGDVPRLVIPTFNRGRYIAVSGRDLRPDVPKDQRWKDTSGSRKIEFYGLDMLTRKGYPVVLCEDALSALSIIQECRELVNAVATAGIEACRTIEMVAELAVAPLVPVAFDADAPGDEAADWWLKRLSNAKRLRPLLKDANDMLMAGWDLRQWIEDALPQQTEPEPGPEPFLCEGCGIDGNTMPDVFFYDEMGLFAYCPTCWEKREQALSDDPYDIPIFTGTNEEYKAYYRAAAIREEQEKERADHASRLRKGVQVG
jgi:DNA primase